MPVLARVGMERELAERSQIGESLKDFGWLFGQVHFVEDGFFTEPRRAQDLVGGLHSQEDIRPDGLFTEEVEGGFLHRR